ncbi:NYN domain-containing protein [Fusarium venenatum]|uniref:NYN domain-containing protein n=1 Tax=Fusarium venenatum TaxID=56646 RepID=UPI001D510394|nr:NYN domain-containing protein [Fusarium venenatum]
MVRASVMASLKLAVLIDADNANAAIASSVLREMAKYGKTFARRAYGDWTGTGLNKWKERLLEQSIQPIQQFAYTKGKNSTDSAMIIDAMDLLYSKTFDGFCIVSSDSDFTRLASRIRESGLVVYGCGERKTPKPFVTACDKFIYVENLVTMTGTAKFDISGAGPSGAISTPSTKQSERNRGGIDAPRSSTQVEEAQLLKPQVDGNSAPEPHPVDSMVIEWLRKAIEMSSDGKGWAPLAEVGSVMVQWHSDFDPRTFGFKKLNALLISTGRFEISHRSVGDGKTDIIYSRYLNE